MKRQLAALVLVAGIIGFVVPQAPAQATPHAGAMTCNFRVIWAGPGSCTGTIVSADLGSPDVHCLTTCSFTLIVESSSFTCVQGEIPQVTFAQGRVWIDGQDVSSFWLARVAAGVVLLFDDGAGAGAYVPLIEQTPPPTCENGWGSFWGQIVAPGVI